MPTEHTSKYHQHSTISTAAVSGELRRGYQTWWTQFSSCPLVGTCGIRNSVHSEQRCLIKASMASGACGKVKHRATIGDLSHAGCTASTSTKKWRSLSKLSAKRAAQPVGPPSSPGPHLSLQRTTIFFASPSVPPSTCITGEWRRYCHARHAAWSRTKGIDSYHLQTALRLRIDTPWSASTALSRSSALQATLWAL